MGDEASQLRAELAQLEQKIRVLEGGARLAGIGVFERNVVSGDGSWSKEMKRIYGLPDDWVPVDHDAVFDFCHPEDREALRGAIKALLAGGSETTIHRHRIIRPDGELRHLESHIELIRDAKGNPFLFRGTSRDRTQSQLAENALQQARDKLSATLKALPDLLFEVDDDGRIFDFHAQRVECLAVPPEQFLGKTFHECLPQKAADACHAAIRGAAKNGHALGTRYSLQMPNGERWFEPSVARKPGAAANARYVLLARDVTERVTAEHRSARQARLLDLIFQHSLDNLVILDANYNFVYVSDSYARGCHMSVEDLIGRNHFEIFPSAFEEELAPFRRSKQTYRRKERPFVFPENPEWGTSYWDLALVPILDAAGEIEFFLFTLKDVTDQKRAEDKVTASLREKETLLREIHHRVKNNLQVVSSLLYLQSVQTSDAALQGLLRDSQNRIYSMALVHQQLYEAHDLARIPFGRYIEVLARSLYDSHGISRSHIALTIDAGPLELDVSLAMSCGLILHELVSNCLKHAFPGGRKGAIDISVIRKSESTYCLRVSDNGVGIAATLTEPQRKSLGSRLVERLVTQIGGELVQTSDASGTRHDIRFFVAAPNHE